MKTTKQMFGKVVRDIAATERERKEMLERIERDQAESDARLDAPLSHREMLEAIKSVANKYGCVGVHDSDLICNLLEELAEALS